MQNNWQERQKSMNKSKEAEWKAASIYDRQYLKGLTHVPRPHNYLHFKDWGMEAERFRTRLRFHY